MRSTLKLIYPNLANLLQASFNYDWIYIYPDWESAIVKWAENSTEYRKAIIEEINNVLNKYNETDLKELFSINQMDSGIQPPDYGYTYTDWLKEVHRRFEASL